MTSTIEILLWHLEELAQHRQIVLLQRRHTNGLGISKPVLKKRRQCSDNTGSFKTERGGTVIRWSAMQWNEIEIEIAISE